MRQQVRRHIFPQRKSWLGLISLTLLCAGMVIMYGKVQGREGPTIVTDQDITKAVEHALLLDEDVPSHLVDVRTDEGIVRLTGVVPHVQARTRTAQVVETIKGVRSIINNLTVKEIQKSDDEIRHDVQQALEDDPVTHAYQITIDVKSGSVRLTGAVPSWAARDLTGLVASGVYGVRAVHNHLSLNTEEPRPDDDIQQEIQRRLESDVWVNGRGVVSTVQNGVVTLKGIVGSVAEKRRVFSIARMAGVKKVHHQHLTVTDWARGDMKRKAQPGYRRDEQIKETLKLAYSYHPGISMVPPGIDVRHGVVTLSGPVVDAKTKHAAEEVARFTRGVVWVKNFLDVQTKTSFDDDRIKHQVQQALKTDPIFNPYQVTVTVQSGVVLLRGSVESPYQHTQAEKLASEVKGVVDIRNVLQVEDTWTWEPDSVIQRRIERELWWSPFVDRDDIDVSVKGGVATLAGTVDTYFQFETAGENAHEGGARGVKNLLAVRTYQDVRLLSPRPLYTLRLP